MTQSVDLSRLADSLPTDTTKKYAYQPGTGWVEVVAGTALLDPVNFVTQLQSQALGSYGPSIGFCHKAIGAFIDVLGNGTVNFGAFSWATTSTVQRAAYEGPLTLSYGSSGFWSKISSTDQRISLGSGTNPIGSASMYASVGAGSGLTAVEFKSGYVESTVWFPALSNTTNTYTTTVTMNMPGIETVVFRYTNALNSGRWTVEYTDNTGTVITLNTTVAVSAGGGAGLRIELNLTSLIIKITGVTLYTIARSAVLTNNAFDTTGASVILQKTLGSGAISIQVHSVTARSNVV